ncbi:MAG TPA: DUF4386 domain-containing protein [Thermoanaerobaculia bacterium]
MSAHLFRDGLEESGQTGAAIEAEQRTAAKIVGFLYLIQMAVAIFGQSFVRDRLIVPGEAAKTAQNIIQHEQLFRLSIAGDLFVYAGVLVLVWAFYLMVRPVNGNLALLALLFRLAETAVLCVATVNSLVVLRLLSGADSLKGLDLGQQQSLVALALSAQGLGMNVGFILLGLGSTIFAYLLLRSRYVPRFLAGWGIFSSMLLVTGTLVILVFPSLRVIGMAYMGPMGVYEVSLGLWLLIKGIQATAAQSAVPTRVPV